MNADKELKDFIDKSRELGIEIMSIVEKHTGTDQDPIAIKIALLAITKVSACILHELIKMTDNSEAVFDLFVGTVAQSLDALDDLDVSKDEADAIINKLRGTH